MAQFFTGARRPTLIAVLSAALGLSVATSARADDHPNTYVGLAYGVQVTNGCNSAPACDRNSMASKLFGGYRLTPSLATEVSYWYLGNLSRTFQSGGRPEFDDKSRQNIRVASDKTRVQALGLGVNFESEVFDLFTNHLRVGLAASRDDRQVTLDGGGTLSGSRRETRFFPYAGVGLSYEFRPNLRLVTGIDMLLHQDRTFFTATVGASGEF